MMKRYDDLPVVSLGTESNVLADELVGICRDIGFFRVVDYAPEVTQRYERIRALMREFFALDQATKDRYVRADMQGYFPCWNTRFNGDTPDPRELLAFRGYIDTDWPVPGLAQEVNAVKGLLRPIAVRFLVLLAKGLELPEDAFVGLIDEVSWAGNGHSYLPIAELDRHRLTKEGDRFIRLGAHADTSLITLVLNDYPGLEVKHLGSGRWVKAREGGLTVNIGDALKHVTNDTLQSTVHRVMASEEEMKARRFTLSFLTYPARKAVLEVRHGKKINPLNRRGGVNQPVVFEDFQRKIYSDQTFTPPDTRSSAQ